jgi:hypothetical protein
MKEFKNARVGVVDWKSAELPTKEHLDVLKPGDVVRLRTLDGSFFWAEVVGHYGRALKVRSLDNLPSGDVRIGDDFATSVGAVFFIV